MSESPAPLRSAGQRPIAQALTPEVARDAANLWVTDSSALAPLRAVQDFVYAVESPAGASILRLTHESHRELGEVEAELCWIHDLAQRGLRVAWPRRSKQGAFVETVESRGGRFFATVFRARERRNTRPKGSRTLG